MKSFIKGFTGILLLVLTAISSAFSQDKKQITENDKSEIIKTAITLLQENYIFPERVNHISDFVLGKLKTGGYKSTSSSEEFLQALNADLEKEAKDHHLNIFINPGRVRQIKLEEQNEREGKKETLTEEWLQRMKYENFRLRKVERLDGNIGYFNFLNFPPLEPAKESITGAMNFIRNSFALVIDLRENGGGNAETMNFMLSYFLKDSLQTGEGRYRKENKTVKNHIPHDAVINKIADEVPVYILVSNRTSSAAEGFAYTLQQFKRAVIVGEQTKGEGNPGSLFAINEAMYMMIPTIEVRSAVSGKGIDGIGVTPDIQISTDKAYSKALLEICRQLSKTAQVDELKQLYSWQVPFFENELNPEPLTEKIINNLTGNYAEGRKIIYENCVVIYINSKGKRTRLEYLGKGVFQNTENKWLRLVMPFADKPIEEFDWIWDDGGKEKVKRVKG